MTLRELPWWILLPFVVGCWSLLSLSIMGAWVGTEIILDRVHRRRVIALLVRGQLPGRYFVEHAGGKKGREGR